MKKLLLIPVLFLCSCTAVPLASGPATALALKQIKDPQMRTKVACDVRTVTAALASSNSVPDASGFEYVLRQQLPPGTETDYLVTSLSPIYVMAYEYIESKLPPQQLPLYKSFLSRASVGASQYCPIP